MFRNTMCIGVYCKTENTILEDINMKHISDLHMGRYDLGNLITMNQENIE